MATKKEQGKRYVVGVLQEDGTHLVRLDSVRKDGEGDGDHLEAERWQVNGFLRADDRGRLVLESLGGQLEADPDDDDNTNPPQE